MKSYFRFSFLAAIFILAGCTTVRTFKVDAIEAHEPVAGRTYVLVPANPKVAENDLRFIESAKIMQDALTARGYTRTSDSASADLIVALDASVGQAENIVESRPEPMFAETGGVYVSARVPVRTRNGSVRYMRTAFWSPYPAGVVGMRDGVYTATVYEKRLSLTAFAAKDKNADELAQIWSVIVISRDESGDLRSILPMMSVAAAKYVEDDTNGQVIIRLKADDPEVIRVSPPKEEKK